MKATIMPIRLCMSITKSMAELYKLIEKLESPARARELISTIVSVEIGSIQDENIQLTPEELEKRINKGMIDFIDVAKNTKAA